MRNSGWRLFQKRSSSQTPTSSPSVNRRSALPDPIPSSTRSPPASKPHSSEGLYNTTGGDQSRSVLSAALAPNSSSYNLDTTSNKRELLRDQHLPPHVSNSELSGVPDGRRPLQSSRPAVPFSNTWQAQPRHPQHQLEYESTCFEDHLKRLTLAVYQPAFSMVASRSPPAQQIGSDRVSHPSVQDSNTQSKALSLTLQIYIRHCDSALKPRTGADDPHRDAKRVGTWSQKFLNCNIITRLRREMRLPKHAVRLEVYDSLPDINVSPIFYEHCLFSTRATLTRHRQS